MTQHLAPNPFFPWWAQALIVLAGLWLAWRAWRAYRAWRKR